MPADARRVFLAAALGDEHRDAAFRLLLVLGVVREGGDGALPPDGALVTVEVGRKYAVMLRLRPTEVFAPAPLPSRTPSSSTLLTTMNWLLASTSRIKRRTSV